VSLGLRSVTRKVALICESSDVSTGIGRYQQMLFTGLRDIGIVAKYVTPAVPSLPIASYHMLRLVGRDLRAFLANYPLWINYPIADIYHVTSQHLAALLWARRPHGKIVVTVHDIFPYMLRKDPSLKSSYCIDKLYVHLAMAGLQVADHIIAISEYTRQCVVEHLHINPQKISVIYHGIDQHQFSQLPYIPVGVRERYGLPKGRRYLLYVGSENRRKNIISLVRALAEIRRELADVELIKVGRAHFDAERHHLIDAATRLGVRPSIHFLEDVPDRDLAALYNIADVCVIPSLYEGFGFPVLEAMACGTPVVCAQTRWAQELVGSAGLQVNPQDTATFAATLISLLKSKDIQCELKQSGRQRSTEFRWDSTIEKTVAVYEQLFRGVALPNPIHQ
jgi:glycosyltransferase involved in cell wall biosynthesis